jgi:hypothetical protein
MPDMRKQLGTFTYIDDRYVKPHRFKKGAFWKGIKPSALSAIDAAIQSLAHPEIKEWQLPIHRFRTLSLDHPKYVTVNIC